MRNNTTLLLALFVVFSALLGGGSQRPAATTSSGKPHQPAKQATSDPFEFSPCVTEEQDDPLVQCQKCPLFCPAKGLLDTIAESIPETSGKTPTASGALPEWVPASQRGNIEFVIATLPDPVHTHLSLMFDREIEAIQKGAQASGQRFLFSRAWMPWQEQASPEQDDFRLRAAEALLQDRKEELPGVMIFRREKCSADESSQSDLKSYCGELENAPSYLFVLVVGETPTGGVHTEQFQNAMKIIHAADPPNQKPESKPRKMLRILGTSFSGSLDSLSQLLKANGPEGFTQIEIASGTTTDMRSILKFRDSLKTLELPETEKKAGRQARFLALQESGDYGYERVTAYLAARGFAEKEVALLSEDETAYGRINSTEGRGDAAPKLYFPRDIAQLRASYQRDADSRSRSGDAKQAPRSSLPLNLDVTGSDDDSVHSYATLQTPLSQEATLKGIVANLQKHHTKIVIVRATNVLDSLFLCQYLRSAYPDGGLMIFGSDLLFQQDPDDEKLRGVLSVTTYPMVPGIDDDTSPADDHVDQVFPDSYSAGIFNATVSVLSSKLETNANAAKDKLPIPWTGGTYASYGWPSLYDKEPRAGLPARPPLWLTEMGKGGYWPITLLDEPPQENPDASPLKFKTPSILPALPDDRVPQQTNHAISITYGLSWKILWWIALVALGIYAYLMVRPTLEPKSELTVVFSLPGDNTRNGSLFLAGLLLLSMVLCFIYPWMYGASRGDDWPWIVFPLMSIVALGAAGYKGLQDRKSEKLGMTFAGITLTTLALCAYGASCWFESGPNSNELFFARRFTHIESGLSPVAPIYFLLAGFLWCLWFALDGVQFTNRKLELLPSKEMYSEVILTDPVEQRKLEPLSLEETKDLFDVMRPFCKDPWAYGPAVFVVLALFVILRFRQPIVVLESWSYCFFVSLMLGTGLLLVIALLTRLILVWLNCKTLLEKMENLKLRRSFHVQDDFEWGSLWRLASDAGVLSIYHQVNREMECLEELLKFGDEFEEQGRKKGWDTEDSGKIKQAYRCAAKAIEEAEEKLRTAIGFYTGSVKKKTAKKVSERVEDLQRMRGKTLEFHAAMSHAIGRLLIFLTLEWKQEPPNEPDPENGGEDGKDADKKQKKKDAKSCSSPSSPGVAWAERCVCLYFLILLLIPLRRIRSLVFGITGLYVFLLLALTSFHFEPHLTLRTGMIVLFLMALGCIGYVYSQIYRNRTLSRITGTSEASLGWDFWGRMAGFVAVPVLSLLAAQFPELNRFLFSWLEPALQSFH